MADIFDQVASQGNYQQTANIGYQGAAPRGDIFDQIEYQAPVQQPVQQAPQQPDIFDQVQYVPQETQLAYGQTLTPATMPSAPAQSVSVTPGQPLQAGVEQNDWLGNFPIVKDFRQAATNNDWGNFMGSAIQGIPAGPLELGDMLGNIARYSQDLGMQAGKTLFAPEEAQSLPPFLQDMIDQGLEQSISPIRIPQFDMAGAYKNLIQPKMPGAFGGGAFVGQALLPVGGARTGATLAQKIGSAALGGAAMSGVYDAGQQYQQTGQVNPLQTAGSVLLGGGIGALGAGAVHGIEKGMGALRARYAPPPQQASAPIWSPEEIGRFFGVVSPEADEALAAMAQHGAPSVVPASRPRVTSPEQALSNIDAMRQGNPAIQSLRNLAHEAEIPGAPVRQPARQGRAIAAKPELMPLNFNQVRSDIQDAIKNAADHGELDTVTENIAKFIKGNVTSNEVRKDLNNVMKDARRQRVREIGTQGRPALDQAVDDVQNAGPKDAEKAVENWAKQALGEELDPDTLGAQVSKEVPHYYDVEEYDKLLDKERQLFPNVHKEFLFDGTKKFQTLTSEANGIIPANLSAEDLAYFSQYYETEGLRTTLSRHMKAKINKVNQALAEERHRREMRKVLGIPLNISGMKQLRTLTDNELDNVIQYGSEKQQLQAIEELSRRHAEAKVDYVAQLRDATPLASHEQVTGDYRRTISGDHLGRNKNKLSNDVHEHPVYNKRDVKIITGRYGAAKVRKDYDAKRLRAYTKDFIAKHVTGSVEDYELPGGGKLRSETTYKQSAETDIKLAAARAKYEIGVDEARSPVIAGMLNKKFGSGPDKLPYERVVVPASEEEAAKVYYKLYEQAKQSERAYDELKPSHLRGEIERAENALVWRKDMAVNGKSATARANAERDIKEYTEKIERLSIKLKEANEAEKVLQRVEKELQDYTGDNTAQVMIGHKIPHPEPKHGQVEYSLEYKKGAQTKPLIPGMEAKWQAEKKEILAADLNRVRNQYWVPDGRSFNSALKKSAPAAAIGAAVANFFTGAAAQAADLGGKVVTTAGPDIFQALNTVPVGEMAAGIAFLRLGAPKIAKAILTNENLKLGVLWKDTLDNVEYLSKMGAISPDLKKTILNHTVQTLKASWGVEFDQETKALALNALRERHITPKELISGVSNQSTPSKEHLEAMTMAQGMTQDQRNALACYRIAQESLSKVIRGEIEMLDQFMEQNPDKITGLFFKEGRNSLNYIAEQLNPRGGGNWVDNLASHARSNFMDAAFFWNPEFHGTNLTDSFIAGGSFTGPINMLRAWKLLMHDKVLQEIFQNSNLIGGYKADRIAETVIQGKAKKPLLNLKDLDSDMFNANRLTLSTLLQYAQRNKAGLAAEGFKGSDVDFAKAVLTGSAQISDELGMDAFRHVADSLSQVMGVDNFRLNTDILSRSQFGKQAAVFFKQPARVARLAMNYAANGDMKGLYWLMGATAIVGGSAAIPTDVATAWQLVNPESYFKMAHALDQVDLYAKASGQKLTPKIQWTLAWMMNVGGNPVLGDVQDALGGLIVAGYENDPQKFLKAVEKSVPYAVPRVGGIPTRMVMTGKKTLDQINQKSYKSYVETDPITRQPDFKKTLAIPFSKLGRHPLVHFANQYIPGKEPSDYQHKMQAQEQQLRQSHGQRVPPNSQFYPPGDIYNQPSPLDGFFGVSR